jgi:uncharacterized protein YjiS (DUF1127 family)
MMRLGSASSSEKLGRRASREWRRRRLQWNRQSRPRLRDLADDPHLLKDVGASREEALKEAERPVWDITDVYVHLV